VYSTPTLERDALASETYGPRFMRGPYGRKGALCARTGRSEGPAFRGLSLARLSAL